MTEKHDNDALYDAIFDILATTVLIDHRTRDRELVELVHAANQINYELRPEIILPRKTILEHFSGRTDYLNKSLDSDDSNQFKHDLLSKITERDLQRKVLSFMFAISVCDYDLHDEECDFIKTALEIWKADMPTPQDLEPAC